LRHGSPKFFKTLVLLLLSPLNCSLS